MSLEILKKQIKEKIFSKIYYLYSEERYLEEFYFDRLIKTAVPDKSDFSYFEFNAEKAEDYNPVFEFVTSFSFEPGNKVCVIKDYNVNSFLKKDEEILQKILGNINENVILIFKQEHIIPDVKKAKAKKFAEIIEKYGGVCAEFKRMSEGDLASWIIRRAKAENKTISKSDALYIIERCGSDMGLLSGEIAKAVSYCSGDEIKRADIDSVCIKSLSARTFELADEICKKNADKVFMIINELFDMQYEAVIIAASVYKMFCDMYAVKVMAGDAYPSAEISKLLGIKPFVANKYANIAGKKSKGYFSKALDVCYKTDVSLKSSRIDQKILIEKMAGELLYI